MRAPLFFLAIGHCIVVVRCAWSLGLDGGRGRKLPPAHPTNGVDGRREEREERRLRAKGKYIKPQTSSNFKLLPALWGSEKGEIRVGGDVVPKCRFLTLHGTPH